MTKHNDPHEQQADAAKEDYHLDELQKQRVKEFDQRKTDATACANLLSTLMLGEKLDTGPNSYVMAVPGGWIFYDCHKAGIASTYVPAPSHAPPSIKVPPAIVMPNK